MKTLEELKKQVGDIFETKWARRNGTVVPDGDSVKLGNDAVVIEGTVLYADMADSTNLVMGYKDWFAAEVYKAYLSCACEVIKNNGGVITAFDGDRVMAVFIGDTQCVSAVKAAMQLRYVVTEVINPQVKAKYNSEFKLFQSVGIDRSNLFVAKTGVRGANDLVWVGRAANYAAKLCSLRIEPYQVFVTEDVYSKLDNSTWYGGDPKRIMWVKEEWKDRGVFIYKSSWHWKP